MWHVGFAVKNFIKEGYYSVNEIAEVLGISRQALYGMYGNEDWDKAYIDKLKKAKINIAGVTIEADLSNIDNGGARTNLSKDTIREGAKYVAILEEHVAMQDKYIEMLESRLAEFTQQPPVKKMQKSV